MKLMTLLRKSITLTTLLLSLESQGATETFRYNVVSSQPEGCYNQADLAAGMGFQPILLSHPNDENITLYFGYFRAVATAQKTAVRQSCKIKLKMSAEPGMQYSIYRFSNEVFSHSDAPSGYGNLLFSYSTDFHPNEESSHTMGFLVNQYWSPCGKPSQIDVEIDLWAHLRRPATKMEFLLSNFTLHYESRRCN